MRKPSHEGIVKIIEAAAKANCVRLKWGHLEVVFQNAPTEQVTVSPQLELKPQEPSAEELEELRQMHLDTLKVTDPLGYELALEKENSRN